MAQISCCFRRPPVRPRWGAGVQFPGGHTLSAAIVYQSAVRASSPKHKSGAHGEACELADSRSNGFRNCSGSRCSGHDPAAGRESGSNRRRPECCPEFSRTVEMNERNKIEMFCCVRAHYNNKSMPECFQKKLPGLSTGQPSCTTDSTREAPKGAVSRPRTSMIAQPAGEVKPGGRKTDRAAVKAAGRAAGEP